MDKREQNAKWLNGNFITSVVLPYLAEVFLAGFCGQP